MAKVLHITPHMGGGVGKVLSGLVTAAAKASPHCHDILCLEQPEKSVFFNQALAAGSRVDVAGDAEAFREALEATDIVQLEFWCHPAITQALCARNWPAVRTLFWSHISGIHFPVLPENLFDQSGFWALTSPCSFDGPEAATWRALDNGRIGVISSGGGLENLPLPSEKVRGGPMRLGYVGTLNFSKLHPDIVSFLADLPEEMAPLNIYGDTLNREELEAVCRAIGRPDLLKFHGFVEDIPAVLKDLDVLVYLLNPTHYGTAENALVEAMAAGAIPIVLDNPCENHIIKDGETGFIIKSKADLADVLARLAEDEQTLIRVSEAAAADVRTRFNYDQMSAKFDAQYDRLMQADKGAVDFAKALGNKPAEWFLKFHRDESVFQSDGGLNPPTGFDRFALFEQTKGSVFHFLKYFPDDPVLNAWAEALKAAEAR